MLTRVDKIIAERGGSITKQDPWGIRRLAYSISKFHEGNFHLLQFKLDTQQVGEVEGALRVSEDVIRHLLVTV